MKIAFLVDSTTGSEALAAIALTYFSEAISCESILSLRRTMKETPRPDLVLVHISNLEGRLHEVATLHSGPDISQEVPFVVIIPRSENQVHDLVARNGLDMLLAPVDAKAFEAMMCICLPDHMVLYYEVRRTANFRHATRTAYLKPDMP